MGFTKYGAAYLLGVSVATIERRVGSITGGMSYEEFQVELLSPIIAAMVEQGYSGEEISNQFVRFNIDQIYIFSKQKAQETALIGALRVMNYNPQSMGEFLKPIILEFIKNGLSIDEMELELNLLNQ